MLIYYLINIDSSFNRYLIDALRLRLRIMLLLYIRNSFIWFYLRFIF